MNRIAKTLVAVGLGCCMGSGGVQAATVFQIERLTIQEIGLASGGLGTSAVTNTAGGATVYDVSGTLFGTTGAWYSSAGTDDAIIMDTQQGNDAFTPVHFALNGLPLEINTLRGAPSGTITENWGYPGNFMSLDLSGLSAEYNGLSFSISPDSDTLDLAMTYTTLNMVGSSQQQFFYSADWTHVVKSGEVFDLSTNAVVNGFDGWLFVGHLEGVGVLSPVPEAETYAMMLAGLGLVGLMAHRRRKLV
jgi:hypothetical protein